jgi:hypothetical protein
MTATLETRHSQSDRSFFATRVKRPHLNQKIAVPVVYVPALFVAIMDRTGGLGTLF